ncbi:MAG TPA: DNA polymerase III subunit beta [Actinobacteria bacterium]|nr:DNA polymerase III subunit beta [Actinomycetota bacterium]
MRFQTSRSELLDLILFSSKTINQKTSTFILNGVLLEADKELNIFSTDLETSIKSTIDVKIEEKGKVVVPAKILISVLKSLKESKINVELNKKTNQIQIISENACFNLNTLSLEEYPSFPETKKQNPIKIKLNEFTDLISKVQNAASQNEGRAILTGILIEIEKTGMTMVATDSYRLAKINKELKTEGIEIKVIIPSKVLESITKNDFKQTELEIILEENQIVFYLIKEGKTKNIIVSRLLSGKFPEYKKLLPEEMKHNIIINKEKILEVVRRISSISQDNVPIKLIIEKGKITATMDIKEIGSASEDFEIAYGEEKMEIAFNPYYLIDGINMMDGKNIILSIEEPLKPMLIRSEKDKNMVYLLMPIRVS